MRHTTLIALAFAAALGAMPSALRAAPCEGASHPADPAGFLVVAEGDSITFGSGSSDGRSYVQRSCTASTKGVDVVNTAVAGARLGVPGDTSGANSLYGRLEDDVQVIAERRHGRKVLLTVLIGRNDLAGYGADAYAADLARYIAQMRAAGVDRVVVGTLLPSTFAPFTAARGPLDAILRKPGWAAAHGIDAIADFAASPIVGPDEAAGDRTLFGDGTHPTSHGYDLMAPIYDAAILRVMKAAKAAR